MLPRMTLGNGSGGKVGAGGGGRRGRGGGGAGSADRDGDALLRHGAELATRRRERRRLG